MAEFDPNIPAFHVPERYERGRLVDLPEAEQQHARALRLQPGRDVLLLDGRGARTRAVVEHLDRRNVAVRIGETVLDGGESRPYIVVAIGILSDRARFEWLVEKAVELGAREIFPLVTERSEGRIHMERARRIAVAALKQSQRSFLPILSEPKPLAAVAASFDRFARCFVCHETAAPDERLASIVGAEPAMQSFLVMIGPEGGFSEAEIAMLREHGARIVSLGSARLRAETAALVALALVSSLTESRSSC